MLSSSPTRVGRQPETHLGLGDLLGELGQSARRYPAKARLLCSLRGAGKDPLVATEFQGNVQSARGEHGGTSSAAPAGSSPASRRATGPPSTITSGSPAGSCDPNR